MQCLQHFGQTVNWVFEKFVLKHETSSERWKIIPWCHQPSQLTTTAAEAFSEQIITFFTLFICLSQLFSSHPSRYEFYSSSCLLTAEHILTSHLKALFCVEDIVGCFVFFSVSFEHSLLLLGMSQLKPQRYLEVVLVATLFTFTKRKALENY